MAGWNSHEWTAALDSVRQRWALVSAALGGRRRQELEALEELADLLQHTGRQLHRARVRHQGQAMTLAQLHSLWRQKGLEVQQLLQKSGLSGQQRVPWGMARLQAAVSEWEQEAQCLRAAEPVQEAELCGLQLRLEALACAIHRYACMQPQTPEGG